LGERTPGVSGDAIEVVVAGGGVSRNVSANTEVAARTTEAASEGATSADELRRRLEGFRLP